MRLKILVLTNLFPTPWDPLRGAFNRQQFERLAQRHDVHVMTAVDFRERLRGMRGEVEVTGLRTDHFVFIFPPGIGRSLHAACWFASLQLQRGRRLRAAKYDVVLASWAYPDAVAAGWLARWLRIPYVVKVHGSDLNVTAESALRRPQIRQSLRHAGAVVAVSRALADKAVAIGADPSRVSTVYNGVDDTRFAPGSRVTARQRLGLADSSPMILYVGNLKHSKGCGDLLEAFPAVLNVNRNATLIYLGAGAAATELAQRAAALGCAERVALRGAVPHAQLADWFRAADVMCLPSHNEGVPNVVLEAMACGIPVVASRVGGIPEVLPEFAGILVPARETAALSAALIEATSRHWESDRIVEHARTFRWDDNIDRLESILRTVVTPNG